MIILGICNRHDIVVLVWCHKMAQPLSISTRRPTNTPVYLCLPTTEFIMASSFSFNYIVGMHSLIFSIRIDMAIHNSASIPANPSQRTTEHTNDLPPHGGANLNRNTNTLVYQLYHEDT